MLERMEKLTYIFVLYFRHTFTQMKKMKLTQYRQNNLISKYITNVQNHDKGPIYRVAVVFLQTKLSENF